MPSTPNFGFTYPLGSEPLADGAGDIQDFATTADTVFADLLGGTTGQALTKASNTDMDFVWANFPNSYFEDVWNFREGTVTPAATVVFGDSSSDIFTFEAGTKYLVEGFLMFTKAGVSGTITFDFNANSTSYANWNWSHVTYTTAAGTTIIRQEGSINTDIIQVTSATSSTTQYISYIKGIIETDPAGEDPVLTIQPQLIASAGTVSINSGDAFIRLMKLGARNQSTYGTLGGWA